MRIIENQNYPSERALYGERDLFLKNCSFAGKEDGESALKEGKNLRLENCRMELRYPFWHVDGITLTGCRMTDTCRAALWYARDIRIRDSELHGVKALRECGGIEIGDSVIESEEFAWRCHGITLRNSSVHGMYPFFQSFDLNFVKLTLSGKYSFQYAEKITVSDSVFDTKDAFWHAKDVTVRNSDIRGEYLGWYSDRLTLIGCRITGTQPLCYCTNLTLIDCEMVDADLAFEYSDVNASLTGEVISVKNPRSGRIVADRIGTRIITADSVYPMECEITERER